MASRFSSNSLCRTRSPSDRALPFQPHFERTRLEASSGAGATMDEGGKTAPALHHPPASALGVAPGDSPWSGRAS